MGIDYTSTIIIYNRFYNETLDSEYYFGTRIEGVRIELTQAANISKSGIKDADSIRVKIPSDAPEKEYVDCSKWQGLATDEKLENFTVDAGSQDFFTIEVSTDLAIDETESDLPVGLIESENYADGFYQYMKDSYHTHAIKTLDIYHLIPHIEIGGA